MAENGQFKKQDFCFKIRKTEGSIQEYKENKSK